MNTEIQLHATVVARCVCLCVKDLRLEIRFSLASLSACLFVGVFLSRETAVLTSRRHLVAVLFRASFDCSARQ